jgi:hypothetical protein
VIPESFPNAIQPLSTLFFLDGSSAHPGLLFGFVVGLGVWWAGKGSVWVIGSVFLVTVLAWSAAMNAAFWIYEFKDERALFGVIEDGSSITEATAVMKLLTGFVAGLVGAAVMAIGCALFIPCLRGITPIGSTVLVGGLAGLLLYPFLEGWDDTLALLVLLSVWQTSVGAALGHRLSPLCVRPITN